jgi:hypothetical protein
MRRPAILLSSVVVLVGSLGAVLSAASCATYRQDLDRARAHYDKNEYEPALALFRVLEPDIDSFSDGEYAQYAYSRGMTDYRLASLVGGVTATASVADPKQAYRSNARHWLAVAKAVEDKTPGGLNADELTRLKDALVDLNHDVYGGGEMAADGDAGAPAPKAARSDKADKSDK